MVTKRNPFFVCVLQNSALLHLCSWPKGAGPGFCEQGLCGCSSEQGQTRGPRGCRGSFAATRFFSADREASAKVTAPDDQQHSRAQPYKSLPLRKGHERSGPRESSDEQVGSRNFPFFFFLNWWKEVQYQNCVTWWTTLANPLLITDLHDTFWTKVILYRGESSVATSWHFEMHKYSYSKKPA